MKTSLLRNYVRPTVKKAFKFTLIFSMAVTLLACTGEPPVRTAQYAVQGLTSAALSEDGASALIGSIQHGGSYWKTARNERSYNWNHASGEFSSLNSVDIDPSGEFAVTGGARTLVLWNALTGDADGYWTTPGNIESVRLTEKGDYALVGLNDQTARFFDVKRGGIKQTLRTGATVRAVDVSADARLGLTGDTNSKVILWDIVTGEKKYEWTLSNNISTVALSNDGKYAFGAANLGTAKIWSTATGQEISSINTGALQYRKATISQAVFAENNRTILIGEVNSRVTLVQVSTGTVLKDWELYTTRVRPSSSIALALAYGLGNRYYAIGSNGYLNVLE